MITEDYVSFEVAKLLKKKGFDKDVIITHWWYDADGRSHVRGNYSYSGAPIYYKETCFNCPTLQTAMKWLREKKLYINIWADPKDAEHNNFEIVYRITVFSGNSNFGTHEFSSYEEAAEAGIKYCLENLI